MFETASIQDIIKYLLIIGVLLGFFQMVPKATVSSFKWIWSRLKKEKVEELKKELGAQCISEEQCSERVKSAVKEEISKPLKSLEEKLDRGMKRIHTRIDEHLNSSTVKVGKP